jgi:zinc transporter ZupT
MSKKMASIIMAYGSALAALGFAVRTTTPESAQVSFLTGLIGGGACVLWGIAAWGGLKRRAGTILTLTAIAFSGLSQVVPAWLALTTKSGNLASAILVTIMLALTVGMIMYVLHGERPPEFYETRPRRHDSTPPETTQASNRRHR